MYSQLFAITNRKLCPNIDTNSDFYPGSSYYNTYLAQIDYIASLNIKGIILRENDLSEDIYTMLSADVIKICEAHNTELILHNFVNSATQLNYRKIHLPLHILNDLHTKSVSIQHTDSLIQHNASQAPNMSLSGFDIIGTSVHSLQELETALKCGANYVFAGNIYETDCKQGLAGRGLSFLENICHQSPVPVYAIGGITLSKMPEVLSVGASGGCMMSGFMRMNKIQPYNL